jgi:hypothetical protein
MQIPILSGIYTDEGPDFRSSYPRNMIPVPKQQGISAGYIRPGDGILQIGTGPGVDRGGIAWNNACYRVMGNKLVRVAATGSVSELGTIEGTEQVSLTYSFDRLAIAAGGSLYYWNGTLQRVTDPDLGAVLDVLWIDGYFMTTDGTSLVVTDLTDPTSVNPLRYGSSEADPDQIQCLLKPRATEVFAINRYTTELFNNVGGNFFPFARNEGAQLTRGAIGSRCAVLYMGQVAALGGGRDEPPMVWIGANGDTQKLSTAEIDTQLLEYSEAQLAAAVMETRTTKTHQLLYLHLPDRTLVYDGPASVAVGEPVWFTLDSGMLAPATYRARNFVWCYGRWLCGDPTSSALGALTDTVSTHYGQPISWGFGVGILYNEGRGAIFHQLELVCLPGRVALGADPVVWTSYSLDGETWSPEVPCPAGKQGERTKRLVWLQQGSMQQWRTQRFRGTSDAHLAIARLEAELEPLNA